MSRYDYDQSKRLTEQPFYALIMAAMRKADTDNETMLRSCWPGAWRELRDRYWAPGGIVPGDPEWDELSPGTQSERVARIEGRY